MSCCTTSSSDLILYAGPTLFCLGIDTNDNLSIVLQKIDDIVCSAPGLVQNNFVRQLLINENDLPADYTPQNIIDYILLLPEEERTIAETDSKWNIIIYQAGS